jgi:hypothetical protein
MSVIVKFKVRRRERSPFTGFQIVPFESTDIHLGSPHALAAMATTILQMAMPTIR